MRNVLVLIIAVFACPLFVLAEEKKLMSDERLVDLVAGPEVVKLEVKVSEASSKEEAPLLVVSAKGNFLHCRLPTRQDYEVKLVDSKRGVIFTHKQSKAKIVLVRTQYTGENEFVWSVIIVPKDIPSLGDTTMGCYTIKDYDYERFKRFLSSIVP